jgi:ubiquinol-cytochrome c reductase subunit 6
MGFVDSLSSLISWYEPTVADAEAAEPEKKDDAPAEEEDVKEDKEEDKAEDKEEDSEEKPEEPEEEEEEEEEDEPEDIKPKLEEGS